MLASSLGHAECAGSLERSCNYLTTEDLNWAAAGPVLPCLILAAAVWMLLYSMLSFH